MSRQRQNPLEQTRDPEISQSVVNDPYVQYIREVVLLLSNSGASDSNGLKKKLRFLKESRNWSWAMRILSSRGELDLIGQLQKHRTTIDAILRNGDENIVEVQLSHDGKKIFLKGIERNYQKLEVPDESRIQEDLLMLFVTHFPGMKGEGLGMNFLSARNQLVGNTRTFEEYDMRFELYRSDYSLFVRDFCPWMSKANIF